MKLLDLILCSYPLYASYHAIKKPRNPVLRHWLIYWVLWLLLVIIDYLSIGLIPFMGMLKIGVLLPNWSPYMSGMSFNTLTLWIKKADHEAQKHKIWTSIRPNVISGLEKVDQASQQNWWPTITNFILNKF